MKGGGYFDDVIAGLTRLGTPFAEWWDLRGRGRGEIGQNPGVIVEEVVEAETVLVALIGS